MSSKIKRENLNISFFSIGMLISVLGSVIYTFAIGLYVLKLTGSGISFATTLIFSVLAIIIFNPIAGVAADRLDKKKIVILMDLLNGSMFIALFYISKYNGLSLGVIYISTFLTTGLTTVFGIAFDTAKPSIVSAKNLLKINALHKIIDSIASILGPAIGGLVFAFINIELFIIFNGISFLVSAMIESFIDFNYNPEKSSREHQSFDFISDLKSGMNYILKNNEIKFIIYLLMIINFFISISLTVPMPYIINQVLRLDTKTYGIIESFFPIGMIIGASMIKNIMDKIEYTSLLKLMTVLLSIIMILIGLPIMVNYRFNEMSYLIYYSTSMFLMGLTISFIDIPIMYIMQTKIPIELRGRILSIGIAGAKIIAPIGLILSGVLLEQVDTFLLPLVGGIVLLMTMIFIKLPTQHIDSI